MAVTTPVDFSPSLIKNLSMDKYINLAAYINEVNAPDNRDALVATYGEQGITGFLNLVGATKAQATADEVTYWEEARLHQHQKGAYVFATGVLTAANAASVYVRVNDIVLADGDRRMFVSAIAGLAITLVALDGAANPANDATASYPVIGNLYTQGSEQPSGGFESNVAKRTNPFMIMKESYKVSGSQATNIGWIDLGQGDYRWYIKSESDTQKRFMDKREMMLLLGEKTSAVTGITGSEGYFAAVEGRGIVSSDNFSALSHIDDIVRELDKQGGSSEYAMFVNRSVDLAIDDVLAQGIGTLTTGGVTGQYGAFNNDKEMAVNLGFRSFTRGGYTMHKRDWKLLNDPTLLAGSDFRGVAVPMAKIADAKTGDKAPALELNYKAANGYSREMEHWVTGSILGAKTTTEDSVQFNYRSECNLITRAANKHVLLK
tara:strand:- start:492 stop:1787 length:1296 start_codon:yes stop_codon:yes gene_type:complete